MPLGAGIYDKHCTEARLATEAEGVILLVFNGTEGSGFSVQGSERVHLQVPAQLEYLAAEIRKERQGNMISPMGISAAKSQLFILRGLLAEKSTEAREKIQKCISVLYDLHREHGDFLTVATTIFSHELLVEAEDKSEAKDN